MLPALEPWLARRMSGVSALWSVGSGGLDLESCDVREAHVSCNGNGFEVVQGDGDLAAHVIWVLRVPVAVDGCLARSVQLPAASFEDLCLVVAGVQRSRPRIDRCSLQAGWDCWCAHGDHHEPSRRQRPVGVSEKTCRGRFTCRRGSTVHVPPGSRHRSPSPDQARTPRASPHRGSGRS